MHIKNITIDFSTLNERYKTEELQDQIKKSYWRLLLDNAQRNPLYIRELWIQSLEYSSSNNNDTFYVHYFQPEHTDDVQNLDMIEYFILSTMVIHRTMTVQEQSAA